MRPRYIYRKFKKKETSPFPINMKYVLQLIKSPFREYFYTKLCMVENDELFIKLFRYFKIFFCPKVKNLTKEGNLFKLTDENFNYFFSKREPMILNFNGNLARKNRLIREWLLKEDFIKNITDGDTIIDVGSNIGEVSYILGENKNLVHYLIEPETAELDCSKKNLENFDIKAKYLNYLLWKESIDVNFFAANETHDSSIFDDEDGKVSRKVNAKKLDDLEEIKDCKEIKLLKIEAEGAEPEVLEGSKMTLEKTHYVLVDVGPERGKNHEITLKDSFNFLIDNNFRLIDIGFPRINGLFKNNKFS